MRYVWKGQERITVKDEGEKSGDGGSVMKKG